MTAWRDLREFLALPDDVSGYRLTWKRLANLYLHKWERARARPVLRSRPPRLVIEPTNACNLRCPHCHTGAGRFGRRPGMMRLEPYLRLLDEIGDYLLLIEVFNWGEPPRNNVHALLEDHEGRLWIGTYGGGLYRYDAGRFEDFTTGLGPRSNLVRMLYEDRHGMLWVGTDEGGVSHGRPGRFRTHTVAAGLSNDTVRVVFEDRDGRIWIGTNAGGLNLWDGQRLTAFAIKPGPLSRYTKRDALSNDNVLALWQDADGVLWIGTDGGGLWRMHGDRLEPLPAHDALRIKGVRRLLQDSEGDLWVGTDGGGLARRRAGKFLALTSHEGLPSDIVLSLLEDRERNLWVGTRDGLLQRQYPFSSITRWEVIESLGLTRAGNRIVLAYKLVPDIPPPRRQPAAALLRAAGAPYDGGYFADSLAGKPEDILAAVERYLRDPALRNTLPPARR